MKKDVVSKVWQLIFLLALSIPMSGFAQAIQVKGTVLDASGMTVIGASVLEKGTTNGVITDMDGNFELSVSPKGTLVISYVGFQTQEIAVNNQRNFKITLKEDTEVLDEVVVVGYGTMKKSDMPGANEHLYIIDGFPGDINSVNPVDIQSMEVLKDGAAAAIYGSVAANGVVIITTKNGKKGETHIDFNTYLSMTTVAKRMEFLNAEQYKSTIKQMYINAGREDEIPAYCTTDTGVDTNWQDEMMRNGLSQNYMFSVRGGGETAQYSVSYNHADDKGIFLGNDFRQDNARMKLHMSKYIFDLDANLGFRYTKSHQPTYSLKEVYNISPLVPVYDENEKYGFGLTASQGLPSNNNPMADYYYQDEAEKTFSTTANVSLGIKITSWLNFKTSYAYRGKHYRYTLHYPDYISNAQQTHLYPYNSESTYYWEEQTIDNILNFNKEFGKHSLNAMIGSSITSTKNTSNGVAVEGFATRYTVDKNGNLVSTNEPSGFLDPSFDTIDAGKGGTYTGEGTKYEYNRASFFGRINYNFDNRYLIQATMRYDGSSKFGKNNRWGCFPSIALGWRISEEKFFPKNTFINNLKFRVSWGRLGNENALGYYDFQALISSYNTYYGGYVQGSGSNPWAGAVAWNMERNDLKWETTDTKNIGFDYAMFNNRLTGSINYYINQTEDLLITKKLSPSAGYQNPILNVGKIRNRGFELELNWNDRIKDFEYGIGFNLSTTHNEVISLADKGQALYCTGLVYGTDYTPAYATEGKPISAFYLYRTDGIFQSDAEAAAYVNANGERLQPNAKAGDIRFKDINGDGVLDENDREYCGTGIPKVEANLNLTAGYKGFDLSLLFGSAWGHKLFNGNRYFYESMQTPGQMLTSVLDAWTPTNTDTDMPRAVLNDPNRNARESDRFLENGNFVRLRQAQLGYTLPTNILKKAYIEKLRFYISGENLFTITKYSGTDPEFSRSSPLDTGIDSYIFPFTRSFTVGAQLTF